MLALVPAAVAIPALAALALVSVVCSLVVLYEAIRYREDRVRVRHPELAVYCDGTCLDRTATVV